MTSLGEFTLGQNLRIPDTTSLIFNLPLPSKQDLFLEIEQHSKQAVGDKERAIYLCAKVKEL